MSDPKPLLPASPPAQQPALLWHRERFVRNTWRRMSDAEPLPPNGRFIISVDRWRRERQDLFCPVYDIGLELSPEDTGEDAVQPADLSGLHLIVLRFEKFTDGRAYSLARRLRLEHCFMGELRASGDILYDQIPLMLRCCFDSFEICDAATIRQLNRSGLPKLDLAYQ